MNVAALLAGIADPKWPPEASQPRILSPFDESALEVALKLRDAEPAFAVSAIFLGDAADEGLARAIASHRPDHLLWAEPAPGRAWDLRALAEQLAGFVEKAEPRPRLALIGREFGDRDDGALPACLAASLGWPYVGLAHEVVVRDGVLVAVRERGGWEERIEPSGPFVASITNDRCNRLRHPLLKNVMSAKRSTLQPQRSDEPAAPPRVALVSSAPAAPPKRVMRCRMLDGPPAQQIEALAAFLGSIRQLP